MLKWILGAAAAALIVAFFVWQRGSVKTSYVNGLSAYEDLPNKVYTFERDCYIFKLKGQRTDFPLVGDHEVVPQLPVEVSASQVGKDLPGVRILDLVRAGDQVKLVSVRRDQSRKETRITFELLFLNEDQRAYPRLDGYWIMDHSPEATGAAPFLRHEYAVLSPEQRGG